MNSLKSFLLSCLILFLWLLRSMTLLQHDPIDSFVMLTLWSVKLRWKWTNSIQKSVEFGQRSVLPRCRCALLKIQKSLSSTGASSPPQLDQLPSLSIFGLILCSFKHPLNSVSRQHSRWFELSLGFLCLLHPLMRLILIFFLCPLHCHMLLLILNAHSQLKTVFEASSHLEGTTSATPVQGVSLLIDKLTDSVLQAVKDTLVTRHCAYFTFSKWLGETCIKLIIRSVDSLRWA